MNRTCARICQFGPPSGRTRCNTPSGEITGRIVRDDVPVVADRDRNDGLDVDDVLRPLFRPVVQVRVVLERPEETGSIGA
jgi:hypothetical protein